MAKFGLVASFCFVAGLVCGCGHRIPYHVDCKYGVDDPQFSRTVGSLLGPPIVGGNRVETLVNGDQIFPAMMEAIRSAKKTINFETFIYWRGEVGSDFTDALCERAGEGVAVRVMIDAVGAGARLDQGYLRKMREAGVKLHLYHTLKWYDVTSAERLNYRTHRKLLVVDGRVGFTGGAGVADEWSGHAQDEHHYRDTHYRVEGPVVAQLQAGFLDNWMETTGEVPCGNDYFPPLESIDPGVSAQVFRSSSEGGSESMQLLYLMSIAAAKHDLRLASAYFVPDKLTIDALVAAKHRGVHVVVIVPGAKIDEKVVRPASRARWGPLLQAGVEVWEYQPTMYHCKQMIVDDRWVSIGSSNLDARSFRLNDEANLNVLDAKFAAEQIRLFDEDLKRSKRITYEKWRHRPLHVRLGELFASLLSPQL
jgi:cardiolipin synthase